MVALGGTSWAASQFGSGDIANNSLRSADLKNRKAVKGKDVMPNSIPGSAITDASLTGEDLAADSVNGSEIAADSVTGQDIAEESLGIVPNSERVNGSRVRYVSATVTQSSAQEVANAGGISLSLNCTPTAAQLSATANTGTVAVSTATLSDTDNSAASPPEASAFDSTAAGAFLTITPGATSSAGMVRAGTGPGSALFQFAFKHDAPCDFDALVAESP